MSESRAKPWLLDVCGCAALIALLASIAYCAIVEGGNAKAELNEATAEVNSRRRDLASLNTVAARQKALLAEKEQELALTGQVPRQTPTEEYFGYLSSLAARHNLKILRHNPIPAHEYAGSAGRGRWPRQF
jgi:hypothetical protein